MPRLYHSRCTWRSPAVAHGGRPRGHTVAGPISASRATPWRYEPIDHMNFRATPALWHSGRATRRCLVGRCSISTADDPPDPTLVQMRTPHIRHHSTLPASISPAMALSSPPFRSARSDEVWSRGTRHYFLGLAPTWWLARSLQAIDATTNRVDPSALTSTTGHLVAADKNSHNVFVPIGFVPQGAPLAPTRPIPAQRTAASRSTGRIPGSRTLHYNPTPWGRRPPGFRAPDQMRA